ncbi:MAG: phosphoribosylglycinamide formyltransferase [Bacteroidetes bacterium CG18_big_fil_WC_8_21_14_2_50_41_14]|nr:MAG: phosphoribosylglycinamide formyltransferase [Bacteroidetes bacterium CG18_big_fil_WC_8_21_14_2_50_41_14]PIY30817.1 MAG: phosphoribosylglycinamide formyltransferase [Bacteroidetes bacterium CG_4_10_14_3_um_filter_42_6]PJB55357.1 MAG: phosphoribosylglycinamide formyltransferase [Bacteroidetes bacterium CG_4_9_14_3_um_filter_41_19]
MKKKIVVLASGNGSNAERIITFFRENGLAEVTLVITNNPKAGVLERCHRLEVNTMVASRDDFYNNQLIFNKLKNIHPDLIVLAGFLWLIPAEIIRAFRDRIINIHPALLPAYGGKGMYGHHVHEAVIAAKEEKSGITIHFVNEKYDQGDILFQADTLITPDDTPESLAEKIHQLEYRYFPEIIESLL